MPTYEYRCKQCGEQFDLVQPFLAKPLRLHQECGGQLQKIFHPRGVLFKGSGFYSTDSRSKSSDSAPKSSANGSKPKPEVKTPAAKTSDPGSDG